jgi:hypothetical protein
MKSLVVFAIALAATAHLTKATEAAEEAPRKLAELNGLTRSLAGDGTVAREEVERLFEQGEVIAFRDATRGTTPQAVTYAATIEKALEAYPLKGAGPARVLCELALALASLDGPQGPPQVERFHLMLLSSSGIKPEDARPMPELPSELAEVGRWAALAVDRWSARLPADEAALDKLRLLVQRGEYGDASQLAQKHSELGARADAWRAAALILDGQPKRAEGPAASAQKAGGEPAQIVRAARLRRARLDAAKRVGEKPIARCHEILDHPAGTGGGEVALACALLLWDEPDRAWLGRAAELVPAGPAGASVRAADRLRLLFGAPRPDATARAALIDKLHADLLQLPVSADERRALWLLGQVGAADKPAEWGPVTPDEQKEMLALDRGSPCDAATFALRTMAVRGNPLVMGQFAASVVERCLASPGGVTAASDAIGMLLTMAHDPTPTVRAEVVEQLAESLAKAHPNDPLAIAAHADAVAAHVLGHRAEGSSSADGSAKAPLPALEAALARYEEALKHVTPASGGALRARLDANAGFLSLAVAARLDEKKRDPFLVRAQKHLRFALALDDSPAPLATRARFDALAKMRMGAPPSLDRLPPSPERTRAACLLAAQASKSGQFALAKRYRALSQSKEASSLDTPELLLSPHASFNVALDEQGLHPATAMRAQLWLAPPCSE